MSGQGDDAMDERDDFELEPGSPPRAELLVDLEGYEGPLDLLLELAREQKVDLTRISILALADQYLAFIQQARDRRLEIAADYLVMAAWLAYLKSRLLLPEPEGEGEPSGAQMAAALRYQLQRLEAMREAGVRLLNRPQLGQAFFARGEPQPLDVVSTTVYDVSLYELLQAYARNAVRAEATSLHIAPMDYYSVEDALQRLESLLGSAPGWRSLSAFLPPELKDSLHGRSAVASTLSASLELVREGKAEIRQDGTFGPIYLRSRDERRNDQT